MDDKSMYVISSDRGQIPGQLQFNYRRRYSSEIGIISDAIHEWANLISAVVLTDMRIPSGIPIQVSSAVWHGPE